MDTSGLDQIVTELCRLLEEQVETVTGRKYNDLSEADLAEYERRKLRILQLRSELQKFVRPM